MDLVASTSHRLPDRVDLALSINSHQNDLLRLADLLTGSVNAQSQSLYLYGTKPQLFIYSGSGYFNPSNNLTSGFSSLLVCRVFLTFDPGFFVTVGQSTLESDPHKTWVSKYDWVLPNRAEIFPLYLYPNRRDCASARDDGYFSGKRDHHCSFLAAQQN
ncbi:hypothetical protein MVEN_02172100 [Mycena venus]|uniref:Uncharacterized protein n=1 Tax=Mycena venus TaxID=2733690 RepID=A0A8H6X880_9AGAR|nr:hypothetical protein MVEN_02172100 [Mycena venus]